MTTGRTMEIVVCAKPVPDLARSKITLDPVTKMLRREGVDTILNPLDRHALEAGLAARGALGGRVRVIGMAPLLALEVLREALAHGADEALLLSDPAFAGGDTLATARVLAAAIRRWVGQPDLVFCGAETVDGSTGQVGPQLAHLLGLAHVSYVCGLERLTASHAVVRWQVEEGHARVEVRLPALLTVTRQVNHPRGMDLMGVVQARDRPLLVWSAGDLGIDAAACGLAGSPTRMGELWMPESTRRQERLDGEPEVAVQTLVGRLRELGVLP